MEKEMEKEKNIININIIELIFLNYKFYKLYLEKINI